MQEMTEAEIRMFLLGQPRTGKLATVRPDGRPHVAPIWFDLDGETVIFTTWHTTVKAQNIRDNGEVAMCVDEESPPFSFVLIEGTASLVEDDMEALSYWATRIAGRYMGANQAESYGRRNAVEGELLVRVTPAHIVARKNIAD